MGWSDTKTSLLCERSCINPSISGKSISDLGSLQRNQNCTETENIFGLLFILYFICRGKGVFLTVGALTQGITGAYRTGCVRKLADPLQSQSQTFSHKHDKVGLILQFSFCFMRRKVTGNFRNFRHGGRFKGKNH